MKFSLLVLIIAYFSYCNGKSENSRIEKRVFSEENIPTKVLQQFIHMVPLYQVSEGVDSFEIRKWGPFLNDSFPVFMERYFYEKGKFQAEVYFFCKKNGHPILSSNDLTNTKDLKFEKYPVGELPIRYLDSLSNLYSLFKIDSFDVNAIKGMREKGYLTHTTAMVLIEQSSRHKYVATFTNYPESFSHLNPNYAFLSVFHKFTEDSLLLRNDGIKKWINDRTLGVLRDLQQ
jgi:hypothetical protein